MTAAAQIERPPEGDRGRDDRGLVLEAQQGGPARDRLVESYLPLIARIAQHYRGAPSIHRAELMQEGVVGLLRALDRFDPDFGTPFWAYAAWWVRQAMQQLVCELSGPVVLSDRAVRQLARVRSAERSWYQEHGHAPSTGELSSDTGLPSVQITLLLSAVSRARGLDDGGGADGDERPSVGEALADPRSEFGFDSVVERLTAAEVPELLSTLCPREQSILRARFGLGDSPPKTLREVAAGFDLSAERVRQIEQGALGKLREVAGV
jgi:RNA polymerase sigma factor (sigma-70 family)